MQKINISREEWECFTDWNSELTRRLEAFQVNFLTDGELSRIGRPPKETPEWNDALEKSMLDEMEAWHEKQKQELIALAEKLGCNIYLAGYLKQLDEKLNTIAEVFGSRKVMVQEAPKRRPA